MPLAEGEDYTPLLCSKNSKPLFKVDIKINSNTKELLVYPDDTLQSLGSRFCQINGINPDSSHLKSAEMKIRDCLLKMVSHKNVAKCLKDKISKFTQKNSEAIIQEKVSVPQEKENSRQKRKNISSVVVNNEKKQEKSLECTGFRSSAKERNNKALETRIQNTSLCSKNVEGDLLQAYKAVYCKAKVPALRNMAREGLENKKKKSQQNQIKKQINNSVIQARESSHLKEQDDKKHEKRMETPVIRQNRESKSLSTIKRYTYLESCMTDEGKQQKRSYQQIRNYQTYKRPHKRIQYDIQETDPMIQHLHLEKYNSSIYRSKSSSAGFLWHKDKYDEGLPRYQYLNQTYDLIHSNSRNRFKYCVA